MRPCGVSGEPNTVPVTSHCGVSEEPTTVPVASQFTKPHNLSLSFLKILLDLTFYFFHS